MSEEHPKSLLISGESGTGKSFSLMNLEDPKRVVYFNCDYGKPLPFKNDFKKVIINDPEDIITYLQAIEQDEENTFYLGIIDTISFMMDMYETQHVLTSNDTQKAWGHYAQFFKRLMTAASKANIYIIFLGHLDMVFDENSGTWKSEVPVKGALKRKGLEAFFTTVISTKKVEIRELKKQKCDDLHLTERDLELGFKHVFQTRTTKQTLGDRIRSPFGLFNDNETYIDNDAQAVIERLQKYYAD